MTTRQFVILTTTLTIFLSLTTTAFAQGMIISNDQIASWTPEPFAPTQPITLESESIEIDLDDQFAHVKITQIFRNNTWTDLEGIYMFPLPQNADISDFALWMDGRELSSETMGAVEANRIYQNIVATMRDPGLLEYVGDGLIRAHIYPIPANGTKQVDIYFDWLLPIENNLISMNLPLSLDGYSIDAINSLAITVRIDSPDALGSIYSPTHDIDINRNGSRDAVVSLEKGWHRPEGDFILYISRPDGAIGLNLLTESSSGDEGHFLAMIAPEYNESGIDVVAKDFIFVLDTSGSMSGNKIEQAKDATHFIFQNLNSDDRFSLITFATDVYPYFEGWKNATRGNISDVKDHIDGISAGGSTNIEGVLNAACTLNSDTGRPLYIIFLTDGLPTVGNTNTAWLVENMKNRNQNLNARLFCFGVGDDVDYPFIDRLARENGGYTSSVGPYEDLELPLSEFYSKIKSPVLTDIEIEINGTRIYDMLPAIIPDLFLGSQILLTGRYNGEGNATIRMTGMLGSERVTFSWPVKFKRNHNNDFIARHWATRRVGYLLNEIRIYGENQEIVDEIIGHSQRYGIVTPYTSMLVTEDQVLSEGWDMDAVQNEGFFNAMRSQGFGGGAGGGGFGGGGNVDAAPAPSAQQQSLGIQGMEYGDNYENEQVVQQFVQNQGGKTFYQNTELYWVDSEYNEDDFEPVQITYLSDEYFDLINDIPDLAEFLSVGEQVIFVYDNQAYQVNLEEE